MSFGQLCITKELRFILFPLLLVLMSLFKVDGQGKKLYGYQDLSKTYYEKQKDSLKKTLICPSVFKEKNTQKKYKELWDGRTNFITGAMQANAFIHEQEVFDYVDQLIREIEAGNKQYLPHHPLLLIDRSSSVNAYAVGANIIAVNLGLITFASSREEICLVIAHELSHNILDHADHSMKEQAEWFTSDEYKASLNDVLKSKYERLTKLKKVFQQYSFSNSKHHRYHESDADSLAVILLRNSHISFDPQFFLRLDSADIQYKQPLKTPLKEYFSAYNLPVEDWWLIKKTRGLSTKNYNFKDTTGIEDSLKTHPDCKVRYEHTLVLATQLAPVTAIPLSVKDKATKMMIWNMFDNLNLTAALYRILLEKDKGTKDPWYDFMIHNICSALYYSDKQLNRFNAVGIVPKEYISSNYYELQNMLEQMRKESIEQYCTQLKSQPFWQSLTPEERGVRTFWDAVISEKESSEKVKDAAAKDFLNTYSASMYCELADHFRNK